MAWSYLFLGYLIRFVNVEMTVTTSLCFFPWDEAMALLIEKCSVFACYTVFFVFVFVCMFWFLLTHGRRSEFNVCLQSMNVPNPKLYEAYYQWTVTVAHSSIVAFSMSWPVEWVDYVSFCASLFCTWLYKIWRSKMHYSAICERWVKCDQQFCVFANQLWLLICNKLCSLDTHIYIEREQFSPNKYAE